MKVTIEPSEIPAEISAQFRGSPELLTLWVNAILLSKIPKWATDDYKGSEEDFTTWLREVARETRFKDMLKMVGNDRKAIPRAEAEIEFWITSRTKKAKSTIERAFIYQLYQANSSGWYHNLPGEVDSIEEYLALHFDEMEDQTSEFYDYRFIIEHMMPILKQAGAKPEEIWGLSIATSKARASVPPVRQLLKENGDKDGNVPQHIAQEVLRIAKKVSDPGLSVNAFKQDMDEVRGRTIVVEKLAPIPISRYMMPGGEQWILIKAPNEVYFRTVQLGVKGITASMNTLDPYSLVIECADMLRKGIITESGRATVKPVYDALTRHLQLASAV